MKNVGELAICGLNVACKVALIAQSQCFFCPFLLHTYVRNKSKRPLVFAFLLRECWRSVLCMEFVALFLNRSLLTGPLVYGHLHDSKNNVEILG